MNKIDEIALRVAAEIGAVSYSPPPFRAVRGYSFTYDDLWRFTRALVADPELLAELSKEEEPAMTYLGNWIIDCGEHGHHNMEMHKLIPAGTKLFARPIAVESEHNPVFAFRRKGLDDFCTCDERRFNELSQKPNLFEVRIFYNRPANTAEIEQRVAEAIAKMCEARGKENRIAEGKPNGDRDEFYCADDIRAERWREFQ